MADTADRDANHALRARFDEVTGHYRRLRSGLDDLQQQLGALRVSVTSRDGNVTATVDARGHLVDLKLRKSPSAAVVLTTVRAATDQASTQVRELMATVLPEGSGALTYLRDGDLGSLLRRADEAMQHE